MTERQSDAVAQPIEISVVIPVYGAGPHLQVVLEALRRQRPPVRRIIVSHSGTGDPSSRLRELSDVTVLHSPKRLFAGAARNRGVAMAETEWVAFIDEDMIVGENWHRALQQAISRRNADCIIGSIGYAASGGYWGMSLWFSEFSSVHPYLVTRSINSGPSANLAISASALIATGGFPEDWPTGEELLMQAQLAALGFTNWFEPSMVGKHVNLPGLIRMVRHAYPLGRGSAKVRRIHKNLAGASAISWPPLSLGLWLAHMVQIWWRILKSPKSPLLTCLIHTPGILVANLAWNAGFCSEAFRRASQDVRPIKII